MYILIEKIYYIHRDNTRYGVMKCHESIYNQNIRSFAHRKNAADSFPIRKPRYKTSLLGDNPKGAMS